MEKDFNEVRYDFCLLFDAKDCNPNGDPDLNNSPRIDDETGEGLITDVCLKRKIRNYIQLEKQSEPGYDIYISSKAILNDKIAEAAKDINIDLEKPPTDSADGKKRIKTNKTQGSETDKVRKYMCNKYYDIRAFGGVLSTGINGGKVTGPISMNFARTLDRISVKDHSITRIAVATTAEAENQGGENHTFGNKYTVSYGLYKCFGGVSPHQSKNTGFSKQDFDLFLEACKHMFLEDTSASRPRNSMVMRKIIVFKHSNKYGSDLDTLYNKYVNVTLKPNVNSPRSYNDYNVIINGVSNNDILVQIDV